MSSESAMPVPYGAGTIAAFGSTDVASRTAASLLCRANHLSLSCNNQMTDEEIFLPAPLNTDYIFISNSSFGISGGGHANVLQPAHRK